MHAQGNRLDRSLEGKPAGPGAGAHKQTRARPRQLRRQARWRAHGDPAEQAFLTHFAPQGRAPRIGEVWRSEETAATLRAAFRTDVDPILAMARLRAGAAIDPIAAYRASGYRARVAALRPKASGGGGGIV